MIRRHAHVVPGWFCFAVRSLPTSGKPRTQRIAWERRGRKVRPAFRPFTPQSRVRPALSRRHTSCTTVSRLAAPGARPYQRPTIRRCNMAMETLHDLYVEELRDLYNAENQLLKALPKMAKAAT